MPLPPPRRESFHFSPTGTNPPDYSSLVALANDFSPGSLTLTQNEKAVLKESYTVSSTSSYSYSETNANSVQQAHQSTVLNDISNCSAPATTNTQVQERKVSSLKLTPVTVPDPPAHCNSFLDPQPKTQTTGSPPPTSPPPQKGPTLSQPLTQAASVLVHLGPENLKHPDHQPSNSTAGLKVPNRAPNQTQSPAPSQAEILKAPPAVPPRPSPAELLVHNWLHTVTAEQKKAISSLGFCLGDIKSDERVTHSLHHIMWCQYTLSTRDTNRRSSQDTVAGIIQIQRPKVRNLLLMHTHTGQSVTVVFLEATSVWPYIQKQEAQVFFCMSYVACVCFPLVF